MNKEKVYVIGYEYDDFCDGGFDILCIVNDLKQVQIKIKEIIKEHQDYINHLEVREFILNDKDTQYKEIEIKI